MNVLILTLIATEVGRYSITVFLGNITTCLNRILYFLTSSTSFIFKEGINFIVNNRFKLFF